MYRGWPVLFHTTGSVGCPSLDQKDRGFLEPSRRVLHLTKLPMPRSAKPLSAWNGCLALCLMGTEIKNSSGTKLGIAKYRENFRRPWWESVWEVKQAKHLGDPVQAGIKLSL